MARMISIKLSTLLVLKLILRHIRMCIQLYGENKYSTAIQHFYDVLKEKYEQYEDLKMERLFAHDTVAMSERHLKNMVRTVFNRCKEYERENNDSFLLKSFFPGGRFGGIIKQDRTGIIRDVEQIILKFENLGEKHPLFKLAAMLKAKVNKLRKAISSYNEALRQENLSQAEVELAKEAACKQYAKNHFDAKMEKGRSSADDMFPNLYVKAKNEPIENGATEEGADAA